MPESFPHESKLSIQILGVKFDYDELSKEKNNFEAILNDLLRVRLSISCSETFEQLFRFRGTFFFFE